MRGLPPDLALAVQIAYTYGWRVKSEVLTLTRGQVDLDAGTLRLEPGSSKNRDGRLVYLTPELRDGLKAQLARVEDLERTTGKQPRMSSPGCLESIEDGGLRTSSTRGARHVHKLAALACSATTSAERL
jgi:integrase